MIAHIHAHAHTCTHAYAHPHTSPPRTYTHAHNLVGAVSRANVFAGDDGHNGPALGEPCPDSTMPIAARGDIVDVHPHGEAMIL